MAPAMWTLLCAAERIRNGARADDTLAPQPAQGNGAPPSASARAERPQVRLYMHPGRLALGAIDLERADEQFDLGTARVFASLAEAEPACASSTGFLLEVCGAARNGSLADGAVLFVERLRR